MPSRSKEYRDLPRIVIVGGGFAGLAAARSLDGADAEVILVDRTNHHLFQPLLYQVATGVLSPADICSPLRFLLRKQRNLKVRMAEVEEILPEEREVRLGGEDSPLPYDHLILAAGGRHDYFGRPEWEALAPGLKTLEDARRIRTRFLQILEEAERTTDPEERKALLTVVVVGGGPTGVELAGVLPSIVRKGMRNEFRTFAPEEFRTILLEGGERVLPAFPRSLSARATRDLRALGVDVRTGAQVTDLPPGAVLLGEDRIEARTVFWAAGNRATPLLGGLDIPLDRGGRVRVAPDLHVPGHPEILVVGDAAAVALDAAGTTWVPGVAPAAIQMGKHAARNVLRTLRGENTTPFRYRDKGNLAVIGRNRAVATVGPLHLQGWVAWFFWLFIHLLYLVGFRNRLTVLMAWGYAFLTYRPGARILPGPDPVAELEESAPSL